MSLVEPWSAIHYLAGRMLKEYVSQHSEYKGVEIDCEALVKEARGQVIEKYLYQSDGKFPLKIFHGKDNFDEGIEHHFNAAIRQFVAAKMIYENEMRLAQRDFSDYEREELFYKLGKSMVAKYSCGIQHTAACDLLKHLKKNLRFMRSKTMNKANKDKKFAEQAVLTLIVKQMLEELRPAKGWAGNVTASQDIAKEILLLRERFTLPITRDEKKLFEQVSKLIELDPAVIKTYRDNAKNPREDPAVRRRVKFGEWE